MNTKTIIRTGLLLIAVAAVALAPIISGRRNSAKNRENILTFDVRKGTLVISITESGTIEAQDKIILKSAVEGGTTIIWIIDEGKQVKKGDLLVELDASKLEENLFARQIKVQNAESGFMRTKEDLEITKNQAASDIEKAEVTLRFAQQDYKKYVEGEYPQQLREAEIHITLAKEDLQRSEEKLKWSNVLFKQKLISQTELQADELAAKKAALDLELAHGKQSLLDDYTNKRELARLKSDIKQAEMALERVQRKAKSNILQTEIDLAAKKAEFKRQSDKLKEDEDQIKATKIFAPSDGLVLYASSLSGKHGRKQEPLAAGSSVYERQPIILLPNTSKMMASIKIHETNIKKLSKGMPAHITVDALPDCDFTGHIEHIAPLPDPSSFWMNPDLKVYNTEVYIDTRSTNLRSGMTCEVEIIAETHTNALYVPIQSVIRINGESKVFIVNKYGETESHTVDTGSNNGRMIHILSGISENDQVMLSPPLTNSERAPLPNKTPAKEKPQPTKGNRERK